MVDLTRVEAIEGGCISEHSKLQATSAKGNLFGCGQARLEFGTPGTPNANAEESVAGTVSGTFLEAAARLDVSGRTSEVKKASQFKLASSKPGYSYAAFPNT